MELNIERVLEIYKQKVSDLEHDLILLVVRCETLEKELQNLKKGDE